MEPMTVDSWLRAAVEDARRRGLSDLVPLLETLAQATRTLRDADAASRREADVREGRPRD
jgi:hypothetical protein